MHLCTNSSFTVKWLCKDKNTLNAFKNKGFRNACLLNSFEAFWYLLKSQYMLYDYYPYTMYSYNTTCVNLWHGIPLKKIEYDDKSTSPKSHLNPIEKNLFKELKVFKHDYFVVNSE